MSRRSKKSSVVLSLMVFALTALATGPVWAGRLTPPVPNVPANEQPPGAWPYAVSGANFNIRPIPGNTRLSSWPDQTGPVSRSASGTIVRNRIICLP